MFVSGAGTGASAYTLTMGADSIANASKLMQTFGVNNHATRLLEIQRSQGLANSSQSCAIGTSDGVTDGVVAGAGTYVKFSAAGGATGTSADFAATLALSPSALVRVSQVSDTAILFDVVKASIA
jgi:hypothetical protein